MLKEAQVSAFERDLEPAFRLNMLQHPLILRAWKNSIFKVKTNLSNRLNE